MNEEPVIIHHPSGGVTVEKMPKVNPKAHLVSDEKRVYPPKGVSGPQPVPLGQPPRIVPPTFVDPVDLYIRRTYTRNGVTVIVAIDLEHGRISLLDKDGKRKSWVFAERGLEYMQGWQNILEAMKYAISEATKILQARSDDELKRLAEMHLELQEAQR